MFTLLRQRRLRWLGHVRRMDDGRIPKDLLYGELATGKRVPGRPKLRFTDVCRRDMKACHIAHETWEAAADDRSKWRQQVSQGLVMGEADIRAHNSELQNRRKTRQAVQTTEARIYQSLYARTATEPANLELACSVTLDDVPRHPLKAQHHSRLRLTDANIRMYVIFALCDKKITWND